MLLPETKQETLKRLINQLFPKPSDLRLWTLGLSPNNRVKIVDKLPEHTSNEGLAYHLVEMLESLGRIDTEFFSRLLEACPGRETEIRQQAGYWNITPAGAVRSEAPPRPVNRRSATQMGVLLCMVSAIVAFILPHYARTEGPALRIIGERFVEASVHAAPIAVPALAAVSSHVVARVPSAARVPGAGDLPRRPKYPSARVVKKTSTIHRAGPGEMSSALVAELKNPVAGKYTFNVHFASAVPKGSKSVKIRATLRLCHHPTGIETPLHALDCLKEHEQRDIRLTGGTNVIDSVPFEVTEIAGVTWVIVFTLGEQSEVVHFDFTPKLVEIL